jgi:hypothetical protein
MEHLEATGVNFWLIVRFSRSERGMEIHADERTCGSGSRGHGGFWIEVQRVYEN